MAVVNYNYYSSLFYLTLKFNISNNKKNKKK